MHLISSLYPESFIFKILKEHPFIPSIADYILGSDVTCQHPHDFYKLGISLATIYEEIYKNLYSYNSEYFFFPNRK